MRIVHVNTEDSGGAARAVSRLNGGVRGRGHDSALFVAVRCGDDPAVAALRPAAGLALRARRRVRRGRIRRAFASYAGSRKPGLPPFSDDRSPWGADLESQLPPADVVTLHWVAGFVDYEAFFSPGARRGAVVWTLHDMNPFTGGCHYDLGCGRYAAGCGACPQLGSSDASDLSRKIFERKKAALGCVAREGLHVVAPSRWLAGLARQSALLRGFAVSVIPNGLDTDAFAPRDRRLARDVLGIPQGARVLLYVGGSTAQVHKGFSILSEALRGAAGVDGLVFASVGPDIPDIGLPAPHVRLRAIDRDRWLSLAYSAADFSVVPSIQDNFTNTVLESLACGTPVVAFDAGGIPEMVRPGVTGFLAPAGRADALRDAAIAALNAPGQWARLREECRRVAVEEYAAGVQARRYAELYAELAGPGDGARRTPAGGPVEAR